MTIGYADHTIVLIVARIGEHHRRDARRIGLKRQHHQVTHHAHVILIIAWYAVRNRIVNVDTHRLCDSCSDTTFDFAHASQVLV